MTNSEFSELTYPEKNEYFNNLSDEEVNNLYVKRNENWLKLHPNSPGLLSYQEYKDKYPKMEGGKCFVNGCNNKAIYKIGDVRYWCGMCEKCSGIKAEYLFDLKDSPKSIEKEYTLEF